MVLFRGLKISACILMLVFHLFTAPAWASDSSSAYSLDEGLEQLTDGLLRDRAGMGSRMVVVTDLVKLEGGDSPLGPFLSREIFTLLARRKVNLLGRDRLEDAMRELKLNMTDLVDRAHAKRFGRFTGTNVLLLGTVADLRNVFKVNVQLVEIETRNMLRTAAVMIRKDEAICGLAGVACPGSLSVSSASNAQVFIDGRPVGETDWLGRLRLVHLDAGNHLLEIRREGYRKLSMTVFILEVKENKVDAPLESLPSPGTAVALSLLLPGAGDFYLGHADGVLYTLGVGGAIYGAVYYSKRQNDWVLVEDEHGKENIERRGAFPMVGFAVLAAYIWYKDLQHVYQSAILERNAMSIGSFDVQLSATPEAPGAAVVLNVRW